MLPVALESPRPFGEAFRLTFITADPRSAAIADRAGVDRIGVDLELIGKAERQDGRTSWISHHTLEDLASVAPCVRRAELFVRVNPIHPQTNSEIEAALRLGARALMLPYFRTASDAAQFIRAIRGRARAILLIESAPSLTRIREILSLPGIDEVMIGLNDLSLDLRVSNNFEVLASPLLDMAAAEIRRRGLPWSAGGVGRVDDRNLPIPADLVHAQYPRLGATGAWLSRSFTKAMPPHASMDEEIHKLRARLTRWAGQPPEILEQAREELARKASQWSPASHAVA